MLSCSCPDYEPSEFGDWVYYPPDDLQKFEAKRRKRCSSCKSLIDIGSDCLEFKRERMPYSETEAKIYGDECEIPMASLFMCEKCSEIYLNLTDAGYCFGPNDDMPEALHDYWHLTGFTPM